MKRKLFLFLTLVFMLSSTSLAAENNMVVDEAVSGIGTGTIIPYVVVDECTDTTVEEWDTSEMVMIWTCYDSTCLQGGYDHCDAYEARSYHHREETCNVCGRTVSYQKTYVDTYEVHTPKY